MALWHNYTYTWIAYLYAHLCFREKVQHIFAIGYVEILCRRSFQYSINVHVSFPQYYGNRVKLELVGRQDELEMFNRQALKMAREVADATGTLVAGNLCNTTIFTPERPELIERCRALFTVSFLRRNEFFWH